MLNFIVSLHTNNKSENILDDDSISALFDLKIMTNDTKVTRIELLNE